MNKVIIVGGVAGGASFAARYRRLNEDAQIILLEKDEYISFANCGLPYYVGDVIKERGKLLVQTVEGMSKRFNLDIRVFNEVISINTDEKTVTIKNHSSEEVYTENYDKLILSPGAVPFVPNIEGLAEAKNVYTLRNIPDVDKIKTVVSMSPKRAVVIGGGFIGVEMAENLAELGILTTLIERNETVMSGPFDYEISAKIVSELRCHNVNVLLNSEVVSFKEEGKQVVLSNGTVIETDLIIMAIGVSPNSHLAKDAKLELNERGCIVVDANFKTSNDHIYAIGDVIEVAHSISNEKTYIPLAGPANRQAVLLANHLSGKTINNLGTLGSSVAKVFNEVAASTGLTEKLARSLNYEVDSIIIHRGNHAGYYPGSVNITLKVVYNPTTREIYGAQAIGGSGTEKRIDVIATAITGKIKLTDLADLELTYAPPFSSAKDPVNIIGYVALNVLEDNLKLFKYNEVEELINNGITIYDVRTKLEFELGHIKNSVNLEVDEIRTNLDKLPNDKTAPIYLTCQVGQRGYIAARILKGLGYENIYNLSGGYKTYHEVYDIVENNQVECEIPTVEIETKNGEIDLYVDAKGLQCPGPILETYKAIESIKAGQVIKVESSDFGFYNDIKQWCAKTNNTLLELEKHSTFVSATIKKGSVNLAPSVSENATIVLFSGEYDKAMAAMIIAIGAASMGQSVSIFCTFWGLNALKRDDMNVKVDKTAIESAFAMMMPSNASKMGLSNMNMLGMGKGMMNKIMNDKNVDSLPVLMEKARNLGVKFIACTMSMDVMGIKEEELRSDVIYGGVASYIADSQGAGLTLFI